MIFKIVILILQTQGKYFNIPNLGLQESIVICVETSKETPVAPYFCDPDKRLEIEVRTCNENPCPPRWNVSDFTTCSQSCGGGIQTRSVQCIQVSGVCLDKYLVILSINWLLQCKYLPFLATCKITNISGGGPWRP